MEGDLWLGPGCLLLATPMEDTFSLGRTQENERPSALAAFALGENPPLKLLNLGTLKSKQNHSYTAVRKFSVLTACPWGRCKNGIHVLYIRKPRMERGVVCWGKSFYQLWLPKHCIFTRHFNVFFKLSKIPKIVMIAACNILTWYHGNGITFSQNVGMNFLSSSKCIFKLLKKNTTT